MQSVRLNVMRSLATELQTHSKTFRTAQKDFLKRHAHTNTRNTLLTASDTTRAHTNRLTGAHCSVASAVSLLSCVRAELREQESSGSSFSFGGDESDSKAVLADEDAMDRGFSHEQEQALEEMNERASEREKEIIKVAQSINELAQLFKELNVLVLEQGTILDRIDYNIEQTAVKVKQGVQELEKADEYSKKSDAAITATARSSTNTAHTPRASLHSPAHCVLSCLSVRVVRCQDVHFEVHTVSAAAHHHSHRRARRHQGVQEQGRLSECTTADGSSASTSAGRRALRPAPVGACTIVVKVQHRTVNLQCFDIGT